MSHRILLVEDSPTMRSFVAATLEAQEGLEVFQVATGFEALKQLPGGDFDLVITDINMPDINGLELIKFVRSNERYKETPLLIISTEGRDRDRERGLALGANEYLVKPFSPQDLVTAVRSYLPGPG